MMLRFLSNTHDPQDPHAPMYVDRRLYETQAEAWAHHQKWLKGKIIGDPQASDVYTVSELKAMGMVGVYVDDTPPPDPAAKQEAE